MTTPTEICERLDAIRVRADRATPGPWAFESHGRDGDYGVGVLVDGDNNPVSGQQETGDMLVVEPVAVEVRNQLDAKFIANARDDVPFLLDLIEAQAVEIERLTKERDEARRIEHQTFMDAAKINVLSDAANARAEAAEAALEKMREAAAIALPILERDRQSLLECCSKLIIEPDGKISVVPDTLDPDAADDVAAYDDAISRLRDALTTQGGERVALSQFDLEILLRAARQEFLKFSDNAGLAHSEINAARKLADAGLLECFEHELREGPPLPRTAWRITSSGRAAAQAAIATQGSGE